MKPVLSPIPGVPLATGVPLVIEEGTQGADRVEDLAEEEDLTGIKALRMASVKYKAYRD